MKDTKQQWFKDAKYGLFIHWGLFSVLAGEYQGKKTVNIAEWIKHDLNISNEEYHKLAPEFNPVDFDADELVRRAKEDWGMKYIVFTAKHCDGFAMFDSKASDYNIMQASPYRKDVVKQLKEACVKYDMKFGVYYAQAMEWDDPNAYYDLHDTPYKPGFQTYLDEKVKPQLRELLTNYGEIALIWFDTPMWLTVEQTQDLIDLVKSIQPNCILSGRTGNHMGDYMSTGDNFIPLLPYDGDWEVPATLNDTWGYNKDDHNWKSPADVLSLMLKINSRGGNYLLNIGPDERGNIPEGSIQVLNAVGEYVKKHAEAIYQTRAFGAYPYDLDWAILTRKDYRIYVHVLKEVPIIRLLNMGNQVKKAYILGENIPLTFLCYRVCEGDAAIEVTLPEEYRHRDGYVVCLETEEKDPVFESIKD